MQLIYFIHNKCKLIILSIIYEERRYCFKYFIYKMGGDKIKLHYTILFMRVLLKLYRLNSVDFPMIGT